MDTFTEMRDLKDLKDSGGYVPEFGFRFRSIRAYSAPAFSSVPARILLLVASWWSVSVFVILLIKSIITEGGFSAFALSGFTNTSTGVMAWLLARSLSCGSAPTLVLTWKEWLQLVLLGLIQGVEIACNNKSLEYLSVSARTMTCSTSVLFMMLTARVWGLEKLGCMRLTAACLLLLGGGLQGVDNLGGGQGSAEARAYTIGVSLQLTSMVTASQRWALVQYVTQRSPPGSALAQMSKSKLQLVQRTLPITGCVCFLLSFYFEWDSLALSSWCRPDLAIKMLGIAAGITVLTVSELEIVRLASAVAIQILSTLHQIPIAFAGVMFFRETVNPLSWFGFSLCLLGGLCYVKVRFKETQFGSPRARLDETPAELAEHGLLHA